MSWHEILHIIISRIKKIVLLVLLSTFFLILILIFVYPKTYSSEVSILPPDNNSSVSSLGSLLSGGDISNLLSGSASSANSQLFVEILKSRTAAQFVVKKLNLVSFYNSDDEIEASIKLLKQLNIDLTKEGIIKLSVSVQSPLFPVFFNVSDSLKKLSAEISNTFVLALDEINKEKLSSKAKSARLYIEKQLKITKNELDSSETELMNFQKKNKTISLPDQLKNAIESAGQLKAEITKTQIELDLMSKGVDENNKLYNSLYQKLEELKLQYRKFEEGGDDYILAFKDIPELGKKLAILYRNVKIQNDVYILLQQQYYKELIQENKDISTVQVLDKAISPKKPVLPRVIYTTIVGFIFFFISVSLLLLLAEKSKVFNKLKL